MFISVEIVLLMQTHSHLVGEILREGITLSVLSFADVMHCFELRTTNVDYYVGEDPLYGQKDATGVTLPPADSGVGAHLAKSWETSIRQALMPVTSHPSKYCINVKF
jgi:hypothetical protein